MTYTEKTIIKNILDTVNECMYYDKDINSYVDNESFMLTMNPEDYEILQKIIKKL